MTVKEYVAAATAYFGRLNPALEGISSDITALNEKIAALQATQGVLTAEDEALLGEITALASSAADKAETIDNLTPPPAAPPV